jgi:hypothetical protein
VQVVVDQQQARPEYDAYRQPEHWQHHWQHESDSYFEREHDRYHEGRDYRQGRDYGQGSPTHGYPWEQQHQNEPIPKGLGSQLLAPGAFMAYCLAMRCPMRCFLTLFSSREGVGIL